MESLYVCLFSNGHIKVGRSATPNERIRQHRDRVACMGVTLTDSYVTECPDNDEGREQILINRCVLAAKERFQLEWFVGLIFADVCHWADQAAHSDMGYQMPPADPSRPDFQAVLRSLRQAGYGQVFIAEKTGIKQSSVSDIATGKTKDPSYSVGSALLRLASELLSA